LDVLLPPLGAKNTRGALRTRNEVSMSRKSGDRSRFNRLRKAKLHDRARIRALRTSLGLDQPREVRVVARSEVAAAKEAGKNK